MRHNFVILHGKILTYWLQPPGNMSCVSFNAKLNISDILADPFSLCNKQRAVNYPGKGLLGALEAMGLHYYVGLVGKNSSRGSIRSSSTSSSTSGRSRRRWRSSNGSGSRSSSCGGCIRCRSMHVCRIICVWHFHQAGRMRSLARPLSAFAGYLGNPVRICRHCHRFIVFLGSFVQLELSIVILPTVMYPLRIIPLLLRYV